MSSWSKLAASSHEVTAVTGGRRAYVAMLGLCSAIVLILAGIFLRNAIVSIAVPKYFMAFNAHPFDLPPTAICYNLAIMLALECEQG